MVTDKKQMLPVGTLLQGGNYGAYDGKKCSVFARSNGYRDLGTSNTGLRLVLSE